MEFIEIIENKKRYLSLLLLADEQEDMINRYIDRGRMFALIDNEVMTICIVTDEGDGVLEIKNIATEPSFQRKGYGKAMISAIEDKFKEKFSILQVGTGDSPLTIPFYESCGFQRSHKIKDFFIKNYRHTIIEEGIQLVDMIYLRKDLT